MTTTTKYYVQFPVNAGFVVEREPGMSNEELINSIDYTDLCEIDTDHVWNDWKCLDSDAIQVSTNDV